MSHPLTEVWGGSLDETRCKTSTLVDYLRDRGVLAYGVPDDLDELPLSEQLDELRGRDADRVRVLKFIAQHPEGVFQTHITAYAVKGLSPEKCPRIDGSDADYQFVRRFVEELRKDSPDRDGAKRSLDDSRSESTENPAKTGPLVRTTRHEGGRMVYGTTLLLDLISQGIRETGNLDDGLTYDRDFCTSVLGTSNELSDAHKDTLASSLQRYVNRVNDYRLLFDVTASNGFRQAGSRTMTKDYKTRFNDDGRIRKMFARFSQSLRAAYGSADNAVLVTLTSDPGTYEDSSRPNPRSILELTDSINPNFHRLTQYLKSDPSTKGDTREPNVPAYRTELKDSVTGRPREKLDYIKALEFTERGLPHLHVLFFDVPTKKGGDLDGCPWLIDKQELSDKWSDYGQGQIVDVYPLVYRDDLDDVGNFGKKEILVDDDDGGQKKVEVPIKEGFVDWYRYGENSLSSSQIEELSRSHQIDMMGDDDNPMQKTAGRYLGKYLSMTFAALLDASGEDLDERDGYNDKFAAWKLGCYWATGKQFWSMSNSLKRKIRRNDWLEPDERRAVTWASKLDVKMAIENIGEYNFSRGALDRDGAERSLDDSRSESTALPDIELERAETTISRVVASPFVNIDYLGAYHYAEIPGLIDLSARSSIEYLEKNMSDGNCTLLASRGDRPPPLVDVWPSE